MIYVLGKRIFNILNHVIVPAKIQISKPIDVSVFMFDLRMINMSSECEYDWYWKISACSTEYEVCSSFASLTRQQTSYSGSTCWYFQYQSIHIQIIYTSHILDHDWLLYSFILIETNALINSRIRMFAHWILLYILANKIINSTYKSAILSVSQ